MSDEMPKEIWARPLISGNGKQMAAVRPESPLIHERKNSSCMAYTKYIRADLVEAPAPSDGYHTFNELYEHRHILFYALLKAYPKYAWKSKLHNDGTAWDGWFIAGLETDLGQATYHIPIRMFDLFDIEEVNRAPAWDGHTGNDVLERIREQAIKQRAPESVEFTQELIDDYLQFENIDDIPKYMHVYLAKWTWKYIKKNHKHSNTTKERS